MCPKSYQQKSALGTHRLVQHGADPYVCNSKGLSKDHIPPSVVVILNQSKSLKRCRKGFRDKTTLRQHELEHTGQNVYFCDLCDLELNGISLDFHMREHSDQKYFTCSICDRHFSTKSKLTGLVLNLTVDG